MAGASEECQGLGHLNAAQLKVVSGEVLYGWIGQQSSSGFLDRPREPLGVFASSDRF
jgi:hypothetical protein